MTGRSIRGGAGGRCSDERRSGTCSVAPTPRMRWAPNSSVPLSTEARRLRAHGVLIEGWEDTMRQSFLRTGGTAALVALALCATPPAAQARGIGVGGAVALGILGASWLAAPSHRPTAATTQVVLSTPRPTRTSLSLRATRVRTIRMGTSTLGGSRSASRLSAFPAVTE